MSFSIVTVNVAQLIAPTPSTLQNTGAIISQGGTTLTPGTYSLLTQPSDFTPLIAGSKSLSALSWTSSVVTATTSSPHGWTVSDTFPATITGAVPTGYNVTDITITVTGASTFTYPLVSNPGTASTFGVVTLEDITELQQMVTTYFGQGYAQAVYVLELGAGNPTDGVTALQTFITANSSPQMFYSYLLPREWGTSSAFVTFAANYNFTTALTYFYVTTTVGFYTNFPATYKCVRAFIESPTITSTEFSAASVFYNQLALTPSSTVPGASAAYQYVYGVTPYPPQGNSALFSTLKAAGVNIFQSAAIGGISNTILTWGTGMDVLPFSYWYGVDWAIINCTLDLDNYIINGSQPGKYIVQYNQQGINGGQAVLQQTLNNGVAFGLLNNATPPTVDAVPFLLYSQQNPGDYKIGRYAGYSATIVPLRGFSAIVVNLTASTFPSA